MNIVLYLYTFLFGACIGSFLNVCIHRIPAEESIVRPRSRCPQCKHQIAAYDNIPILSYLFLRGKCRYCSQKISVEYPLVETITGLLFVYLLLHFGLSWELAIYIPFTAALIVITVIDLHHRIIPDEISYPGLLLGLLSPLLLSTHTFKSALLGALIGGVALLAVRAIGTLIFKQDAMGLGDVKLLAMMGAFLGYPSILFILVVSSFLGSLAGIPVRIILKDRAIPYGPFLSLAAMIYLFWGDSIIHWYFGILTS